MSEKLYKLAYQGIKRRKGDSILTFIILSFTVAFTVITLCLTGSISKTNEEYRLDTYGEWYVAYPACADGDLDERKVCYNNLSFGDFATQNLKFVYVVLTILITFVAAVTIFYLQIKKQVRSVVLFRSIGADQTQLRKIMLSEMSVTCGQEIVVQAIEGEGKPNGKVLGELGVTVGGLIKFEAQHQNYGMAGTGLPYTVIASKGFLEKMLSIMDREVYWRGYSKRHPFGYRWILAFTDLNADYLSTDKACSIFCEENALFLYNRRQENAAYAQDNLQRVIFLSFCGSCFFVALLTILNGFYKVEAKQELRKYGILRALGMLKKQIWKKLVKQILIRCAMAMPISLGIYELYFLFNAIQQKKNMSVLLSSEFSILDEMRKNTAYLFRSVMTNENGIVLFVSAGVFVLFSSSLIQKKILLKAMEV